jgi:hypothetical protein
MAHPDRRRFLKLLAAAGGVAAGWRVHVPGAAQVTAEATPFFAQPDGQRCLVRFFVSGLEAPAGRLRAFDRSRRQLGTAGVLPFGDGRLYGELWLPPELIDRVQTELEAPGLRRPLVTWHTLIAAPRWTVHWVTLLAPEQLEGELAALEPIPRAATMAALRQMGATVDALPGAVPVSTGDVPFLRLVESARRVAARVGIPPASLGTAAAADLQLPTLASVLAASGVGGVVVSHRDASGLFWLNGPDGARVLVAGLAAGADPVSLSFPEGGERMMRAVERFLGPGQRGPFPVALVLGTGAREPERCAEAVREWNARLAFPRIVPGDADGFLRSAIRERGDHIEPWTPSSSAPGEAPTPAQVTAQAAARAAERTRRAEAMISCLVGELGRGGRGLEAVAGQLAFSVPGTLVFNPTSYARSELLPMADGSERVVTDIPPLGYAYFPFRRSPGDGGGWRTMEDDDARTIETLLFRLTLDEEGGSVRSLVSRTDGLEWAREATGLNAVAGAHLETVTREAFPGVGARISATRQVPGGSLRSTLTIYDRLPWVDVLNVAEWSGDAAVPYRFGLALDVAGVSWEIPGGVNRGMPPCDCAHLRWLSLVGSGGRGAVLGALEAATAQVDSDGVVTSFGPRGPCRYRIAVQGPGGPAGPDDPWRLGWGMEPCVTAFVPGTGGATLPSFGRLLVVDQSRIALLGMQPAADGNGVIVYLQELAGHRRSVTLGGGIIGFADARRVDLLERDLGAPAMAMRNGVGVVMPAYGIAALRLVGITVARP